MDKLFNFQHITLHPLNVDFLSLYIIYYVNCTVSKKILVHSKCERIPVALSNCSFVFSLVLLMHLLFFNLAIAKVVAFNLFAQFFDLFILWFLASFLYCFSYSYGSFKYCIKKDIEIYILYLKYYRDQEVTSKV